MYDVVEDDVSARPVRRETDGLSDPTEDLRVEMVMTQVWMRGLMAARLGAMARVSTRSRG